MNQFQTFILSICFLLSSQFASAQETYVYQVKPDGLVEARQFFSSQQFALAYPICNKLYLDIKNATAEYPSAIREEIHFLRVVSALKLMLPGSGADAAEYIDNSIFPSYAKEMKFHLGHYYYLNADYEMAVYMLENYLEHSKSINNDQENQALFELAYCQFQQKDYSKAVQNFETLLQRKGNPNRLESIFYAANSHYQLKNYDLAMAHFLKISNDEKYNNEVPYYIADILYAQGNKARALEYADSVLNTAGASKYRSQLGLLSAKLNFENKSYAKALPSYELFVSSQAQLSKDVLYELSYCYYQVGNNQKAIDGFRQLSNEKDSIGQNSMYILGDLYIKQGDKSNARTAFQYGASNSSNKFQQRISRLNYAKLSYELGYQDIALNEVRSYIKDYSAYRDATTTDPFSHLNEAKELLIALLSNTTNYDEGLEVYQTLNNATASTKKIHARLLYGKGMKLLNEQRPSEAWELFNKIVLENANQEVIPYAKFWKGELAYRAGNYDETLWNLKEFLSVKPNAIGDADAKNANYVLGYASMKKGLYKNAFDYFSAALSDKSKITASFNDDVQIRLADCLFMMKAYEKADLSYKQLIDAGYAQSDYALYQRAVIAGIKNKSEKIKLLTALSTRYPNSVHRNDVQLEIALTHINEEHYTDAIPFLKTLTETPEAQSLRPIALLKLGLCYYNSNDNNNALKAYQSLVKQFPNSDETEEALPVIKDIFIEEGKANEYLEFMNTNGIVVNVSEADSLSYVVALQKYQAGDYVNAIAAFNNYMSKYSNGAYLTDVRFYRGYAYKKGNDFSNAIADFTYVNSKGSSKYFDDATLELARIFYLEQKDYPNAKKYFENLNQISQSQEKQLEGLRGLVRCFYQLKDYSEANKAATDLLNRREVTTDDKAISFLVLGKSFLVNKDTSAALDPLKSIVAINKASWGAEARYELARAYFALNNLKLAEKMALSTISETGSYEYWVTKSYILIGDIYLKQKDYFNAKATFESVANNATIEELKNEAREKYNQANAAEKKSSKIK